MSTTPFRRAGKLQQRRIRLPDIEIQPHQTVPPGGDALRKDGEELLGLRPGGGDLGAVAVTYSLKVPQLLSTRPSRQSSSLNDMVYRPDDEPGQITKENR